MALFPILTSDGSTIVTSDGMAVVVQGSGGGGGSASIGGLLILSDLRDNVQGNAVLLTTTGALAQSIPTPGTLPYAALGATLPNGIIAVTIETATPPHHRILSLNLYGPTTFPLIASVTSIATAAWTATNPVAATATYFYLIVNDPSVTSKIWRVDSTGAALHSWSIPLPTSHESDGLAVDAADAIAYWTDQSAGFMKRWDLVNDVALPDIIATGPDTFLQVFITAVGDILLMVSTTGSDYEVRLYDASGTLLMTYPFLGAGAFDSPELAYNAAVSSDTFWVKTFPDMPGHTTGFVQVDIPTGIRLVSVVVSSLDGGGVVPQTCPFLLTGGVTTYPIRRLRRWAP